MRVFSFLILTIFASFTSLAQVKKALKAMEKSQWQSAEEALDKALEKDSLDVLAFHVLSLLQSEGRAPQFNIDQASANNHHATELLENLDSKELEKMAKADLDFNILLDQKEFIDSIAFIIALQVNTEDGFNHFISYYPDAPQIERATKARNILAYQQALNENTVEAYRNFRDKYPDAEQSEKAKEELDKLLYEQQAKNADLQEMIAFLRQYPDNPYGKEVEFNVFKEMTGYFSKENLQEFVQLLPESNYAQLAYDFLYHLQKETKEEDSFLNEYRGYKKADSLKKIIKAEKGFLIPIIQDNNYGFINNSGEVIIEPTIADLDESMICNLIIGNLVEIGDQDSRKIYNRLNTLIYESDLDSIRDLGNGFIRISRQGKQGLIHKSGYIFFEPAYRDIELVTASILKFRKAESWGLMNPYEKVILEDNLSSISYIKNIISLEKNGRIGLYKINDLLNLKSALSFKYDEVEQLPSGEILCFIDDHEELLDSNLKPIIPIGDYEINSFNSLWIAQGESQSRIFDSEGKLLMDSVQRFFTGNSLIGFKKNNKWQLLDSRDLKVAAYDSLKLMGNDLFISFNSEGTTAHFEGNAKLDLKQTGAYHFVTQNQNPLGKGFLLTFDKDGVKRLYDIKGRKVLAGWFDEVIPLNDFLFQIEEKNKSGLSDSSGNSVLPIEYAGIGRYSNGFVTTLNNGKFGLFTYPEKEIIEPQFDIQPRPYGDSLIIVSKDNKFGIINRSNETILPIGYDRIEFWSPTHALTKVGNTQLLINLSSKDTLAIQNIKYVELPDGKEYSIYSTSEGSGVMGPGKQELVKPLFTDVNYLLTSNEVIFSCGRYFPETDIYIMAYFNKEGEVIWRNSVSPEDYKRFLCEKPASALIQN